MSFLGQLVTQKRVTSIRICCTPSELFTGKLHRCARDKPVGSILCMMTIVSSAFGVRVPYAEQFPLHWVGRNYSRIRSGLRTGQQDFEVMLSSQVPPSRIHGIPGLLFLEST